MNDAISNELAEFFQQIKNEMQDSAKKEGEFTMREFASEVGVTEKVAKRLLRERVAAGTLTARNISSNGRILVIITRG